MLGARKRAAVGLTLVFLLTAIVLAARLVEPVTPLDEGILLVYPELILKGYVPNVDFASLYTPGNYWFLAIVYKIFGVGIAVERSVGLLYVFGIAAAVFLLALERGVLTATALAILVGLVTRRIGSAIGAFSWFGACALALWSLLMLYWWLRSTSASAPGGDSKRLLLFSGVLAGFAILFRHDQSPAILLAALLTIGVKPRALFTYALGVLIGVVPLIVHFVVATPAKVLEEIVWDVLLAGPTRRLDLAYMFADHGKRWLLMLVIVVASSVVPAIVATIWFRDFREGPDRIVRGLAAFCLFILPQALSRFDWWHLSYVGAVTIPVSILVLSKLQASLQRQGRQLLPWANITPLRGQAAVWPPRSAVSWIVLIAVATAAAAWELRPPAKELLSWMNRGWVCTECVVNGDRYVRVGTEPERLQQVINELQARSSPGQALFIGPQDLSRTNYSDSFILHLFPKLKPSIYYIEMAAAVSNRPGTPLSDNLAHADFALLSSQYDDWNEPNTSSIAGSSEPLEVLKRDFCVILDRNPYRLYGRCFR